MSFGFFAETKRVVSIVSRFCKFHLKISKRNKKAKPLFDGFVSAQKKHQPGFFERNISEATRERCFGPCLGVSVSSFSAVGRQEEA